MLDGFWQEIFTQLVTNNGQFIVQFREAKTLTGCAVGLLKAHPFTIQFYIFNMRFAISSSTFFLVNSFARTS